MPGFPGLKVLIGCNDIQRHPDAGYQRAQKASLRMAAQLHLHLRAQPPKL
jgi:hypothetical protein